MKQYLLSVYHPEDQQLPQADMDAIGAIKAGVQAADGPFAEGKEQVLALTDNAREREFLNGRLREVRRELRP